MTTHTPMRLDRLADGPDALPAGTRLPTRNYEGGTSCHATDEPTSYERELFRMRVFPHLYDERDLDAATRTRAGLISRMATPATDADCLTCAYAVLTRTASCPNCGSTRLVIR
jgi:hypothetical protein